MSSASIPVEKQELLQLWSAMNKAPDQFNNIQEVRKWNAFKKALEKPLEKELTEFRKLEKETKKELDELSLSVAKSQEETAQEKAKGTAEDVTRKMEQANEAKRIKMGIVKKAFEQRAKEIEEGITGKGPLVVNREDSSFVKSFFEKNYKECFSYVDQHDGKSKLDDELCEKIFTTLDLLTTS